jgi:hypothetical protein
MLLERERINCEYLISTQVHCPSSGEKKETFICVRPESQNYHTADPEEFYERCRECSLNCYREKFAPLKAMVRLVFGCAPRSRRSAAADKSRIGFQGVLVILLLLTGALLVDELYSQPEMGPGTAVVAAQMFETAPMAIDSQETRLWSTYRQAARGAKAIQIHGRFEHQSLEDPDQQYQAVFSMAFREPNLFYFQVLDETGHPSQRVLSDGHSVYLEDCASGTMLRWRAPTTDAGMADLLGALFPAQDHPVHLFRLRAESRRDLLLQGLSVEQPESLGADSSGREVMAQVLKASLRGEPTCTMWFKEDSAWPARVDYDTPLTLAPLGDGEGLAPAHFSLRQSVKEAPDLSTGLFTREELSPGPVQDVANTAAALAVLSDGEASG